MDRKQAETAIAVRAADGSVPIGEQLAQLAAAFERYRSHVGDGCPFNVGDMVTPRADSFYGFRGLPHVVLEVCLDVDPLWAEVHAGTARDGAMLNMRVGVWRNGTMAPFWCESWSFDWFKQETEVAVA